jgi:acylglycerol lipase
MAKTHLSFDQGHVKALDGTSIFYRSLAPKKTSAVAILLHGYAEHGGRYQEMMTALAGHGIATYTPDHRGHGQTADLLGYIDDLDAMVSDVILLRTLAEKEHADTPIFVLGHSMGGMLTLVHAHRYPSNLAGFIVCGAGILVPSNIPAFMVKLSIVLGRILPKLPVQPFFEPLKLSRRKEVQEAVKVDPLFYRGKIRARTGSEILYGMKAARAGLPELQLPALILQGGKDAVIEPHVSQYIMDKMTGPDTTFHLFEEAMHEVFQEPERFEAFDLVAKWINARTESPA